MASRTSEPNDSNQGVPLLSGHSAVSETDSPIQILNVRPATMDLVQYGQRCPHPSLSGHTRSRSVAERHWSRVRTVMTWYTRLRQIKRTKSSQHWMKLRTTVQLTNAIASTVQSKKSLKREDSFLKRFSTRQIPEIQETFDCTDDGGSSSGGGAGPSSDPSATSSRVRRRRTRYARPPRSVLNPDENGLFYWLAFLSLWVLYNLWTIIVRLAFPELHDDRGSLIWNVCDVLGDAAYLFDIVVQFRTGYLEQGIMVHQSKKLAIHYLRSRAFLADLGSLLPVDWLLLSYVELHGDLLSRWRPIFRLFRLLKLYRVFSFYYVVESRTVYPNAWRVVNLVHILLVLAHWFGCFYFLISESEGFRSEWSYPLPEGDFATLTRKYLGSVYWSTLTLTTIGDLPTPETNTEYVFTIASYLIGVFIFATIVGQVGNVITNRNASRLEFERLLDSAKLYMRHHKVPRSMQRRVQRWYDYSWSRGRIQGGGGDANSALRILPDKLKTELALHVNLTTLKKVSIFKECQPEFLHDLVLKMQSLIFTPGDMVCRRGEVAREMFIIADGILEVISETGKVMTTMQAGEFFGEIGILNLDGLNKRTADVRSVGYAELFSLSRENVLAAMKDYPEAEELLLTLGRKRLLEARRAASQHRAQMARKAFLALERRNQGQRQEDNSAPEGNSTAAGKLINRLRSVAGIRDVLRRSSPRGKESQVCDEMELSPMIGGSLSSVTGRSGLVKSSMVLSNARAALKRMPRVISSEVTATVVDVDNCAIQPLLHHESPATEHEVIGAGLPLLQRLKLLQQKELDQQRRQQSRSLQYRINIISPPEDCPPKEEKQTRHISFLEDAHNEKKPSGNVNSAAKTRWSLAAPRSSASKYPSGYLPKPTLDVIQSGSSVESTNEPTNLNPEEHHVASQNEDKKLSLPALPMKALWKKTKQLSLVTFPHRESSNPVAGSKTSGSSNKRTRRQQTIQVFAKSASVSSDETKDAPFSPRQMPRLDVRSSESSRDSKETLASESLSQPAVQRPKKLRLIKSDSKNYSRNYTSIDDLSPEYTVLPFVKRLKILNERQKIAELQRQLTIAPNSSIDVSTEQQNAETSSSATSESAQTESQTKIQGIESDTQASGVGDTAIRLNQSPVHSPESTETPERRSLKRILKQLSRTYPSHLDQQLKMKLMRSQTVEGYAARHSSFTKQCRREKKWRNMAHTLPSPPREKLPIAPDFTQRVQLSKLDDKVVDLKAFQDTGIEKATATKEEEYFADLLMKIKEVLHGRLEQLHMDFEERIKELKEELTSKDSLIHRLQEQLKSNPAALLNKSESQCDPVAEDTTTDQSEDEGKSDPDSGSQDSDDERIASYFARSRSRGSVVHKSSGSSSDEDSGDPLRQLEFGSCWQRILQDNPATSNPKDVVLQFSSSDEEPHNTENDPEILSETLEAVKQNQKSGSDPPNWELEMLADLMEKENIQIPKPKLKKSSGSLSVDQSGSRNQPRKRLQRWCRSYPPPRSRSTESTSSSKCGKPGKIPPIEEEDLLL